MRSGRCDPCAARVSVAGVVRSDTPSTWDERATVLAMLQYTRDTAAEKCRDLDAHHTGAAPLAASPLMTLGGVISHMRWVEHSWIENRFVDGPDLGPWTDESPDQEFIDGASNPLDQTLQDYADQAQRSDALIGRFELDERSALPLGSGEHPTLRWVLLHLIEENARHNGHLDILREMADGTLGD